MSAALVLSIENRGQRRQSSRRVEGPAKAIVAKVYSRVTGEANSKSGGVKGAHR